MSTASSPVMVGSMLFGIDGAKGWLLCLPRGGRRFDVGLFDFGVAGGFELGAVGLLFIESFQTSFLSRANVGEKFAVTAK